jgi:SAM-dependent methyltransferase
MSRSEYRYEGDELELFQRATNWKNYFKHQIAPYLVGDVAEVGAGLGATTLHLAGGSQTSWLCIEPDLALADRLRTRVPLTLHGVPVETFRGTLASLPADRLFDTVVYIDVLEHIDDDRGEAATAARRLRPRGSLVVLAPAHNWLFSPFDERIGHRRRYNRRSLIALNPPGLALERAWYLDAVGLSASGANRVLLWQSMPTARQIATWDRLMIPVSRLVDPLLGYRFGKTVVAVWRRR